MFRFHVFALSILCLTGVLQHHNLTPLEYLHIQLLLYQKLLG